MSPRIRSGITVTVVLALSGVLFTVSAQLNRDDQGRHAEDLSAVVAEEADRVDALTEQVAALDAEIQELSENVPGDVPRRSAELRSEEGVVSGAWPVEGPGMRVSLEDAPSSSLAIENVTPDDLVVHQQDVQHVINALWAGGAEAMTLQGERVTPTSAFRCSGNIMLLHGKVFSPPYVVEAVGDPDRLQAALDSSPGVAIYRDYVEWIDLGYSAEPLDDIEVPAASGGQDVQFADVPEGTDVFS